MNPLTNMKNVKKLSDQELRSLNKTTWHDQYRESAWIFVGGLPYDLSEGDIVCVFSQYGEIVNVNLIRDKDTGKSKGFCFICYEDQRSTDLAVDNFNGIKILNRTIRVDHVSDYKVPKNSEKKDEETKKLYQEGCAPKPVEVKPVVSNNDLRETLADYIVDDIKLPPRLPIYPIKQEIKTEKEEDEIVKVKKEKKAKKEKKHKKKSKKRRKKSSDDDSTSSDSSTSSEDRYERKKKKKRK
ncbi:RNA recognition motif [Popillia japonica]|uniref:RNA recognition motif n=1 Tax=Popillia japonica TaxID=7064 RepID=A0AAW1MD03_POPJA